MINVVLLCAQSGSLLPLVFFLVRVQMCVSLYYSCLIDHLKCSRDAVCARLVAVARKEREK